MEELAEEKCILFHRHAMSPIPLAVRQLSCDDLFNILSCPTQPVVLIPGRHSVQSEPVLQGARRIPSKMLALETGKIVSNELVELWVDYLLGLENEGLLESCSPVVLCGPTDTEAEAAMAALQHERVFEEIISLTGLNILCLQEYSRFLNEYGALLCSKSQSAPISIPSRIHSVDRKLFIGDIDAAHNVHALRLLGIRRVVNMTIEHPDPESVDWPPDWIPLYHRVSVNDTPEEDLLPHFAAAIAFIAQGLASGEGVLVHCHMGASRSPSLVIAFIMWVRNVGYESALELVRECRWCVRPNQGFVGQLRNMDSLLKAGNKAGNIMEGGCACQISDLEKILGAAPAQACEPAA